MTAMRLKRYPSPSGGFALGKMGVGATMLKQGKTARDYVQNGLVAMWDSIENRGYGITDLSATAWKDCIGGYEIPIPQSETDVYTWTGTSLKRIGKGGISAQLSGIAALNQSSAADAWTIEIGMSMTTQVSVPTSASGYQFANYNMNNSSRGIRVFSQGSLNVIVTPDANWYHNPDSVTLPYNRRTFVMGKTSIETSTAGRYEAFVGTNGTLMTGARQSRYALGSNMNLFAVSAWAETTTAEIMFIRRYHRALTAAEIAANYAIDKERFNLP